MGGAGTEGGVMEEEPVLVDAEVVLRAEGAGSTGGKNKCWCTLMLQPQLRWCHYAPMVLKENPK